jgi:hypothetical protein
VVNVRFSTLQIERPVIESAMTRARELYHSREMEDLIAAQIDSLLLKYYQGESTDE